MESRQDLQQWWQQAISLADVDVRVRVRGNNLYVLCEMQHQPPEQRLIRSRCIRALLKTDITQLLPATAPPIYQVNLYGKAAGQAQPAWVRVIYLSQLQEYARKVDAVRQAARKSNGIPMPVSEGPTTAVLAQSNLQLAKQGRPEAIARQLSEFLSQQGIAVRATVKALFKDKQELPLRRLVLYCEAAYSPDPASLIEPIAQRLRQLELTTFRDAVVYGQVQGEPEPEWKLRIDLTPPTQILQDWARWGDVEAMVRLANQALAGQQVQVSGIVQDMILHLTCWRSQPTGHVQFDLPPQQRVLKPLQVLFEQLAPQGIHALSVYGAADIYLNPTPQAVAPETVGWRERLDLPAASHPQLAIATAMLARRGDLGAISFSLTRVLNADLERKLTTGGLRLQARHRDDLLHVMVDGTVLPTEKSTASLVADCVRTLKISGVNGVRIYGRRAGEKRPRWKDGYDFTSRARLVPEATPEFAASEAYVGDLITQQSGALLVRPDLSSDELRQLWQKMVQGLRGLLLGTQIFSPLSTARSISRDVERDRIDAAWFQELKLASIWGVIGILVTVCADQGLGVVMPQPQDAPKVVRKAVPQELSLSGLTLAKSASANNSFNRNGFTGASGRSVTANRPNVKLPESKTVAIDQQGKQLLSSPVQPRGQVTSTQYVFNVPQLNNKLALYEQFVAQSGVPDILIIGSSRALRGLDPVALQDGLSAQGYSGRKVFNFGVNGATAQMVDLVVRRLIPIEKLPKLVLWADGARAFNSGRVDVTYNAIATSKSYTELAAKTDQSPAIDPPLVDLSNTSTLLATQYERWNQQIHQTLAQGSATYPRRANLVDWLRDDLLTKVLPIPAAMSAEQLAAVASGEDLEAIDVNGFLPLSARFNPTTYYQKFARVTGINDADYTLFRMQGRQTEALKLTAAYMQQQGHSLVFVNLPLSDDYLDGYRRKHEAKFQQFMVQSAATFGFTYRNLSETWKMERDYFSDPSHLNRYGAYAVSQHLAKDPLMPWGAQ
ncbi:DUF1574 domain-containing protein [filamentous cyanobacterium LEGE 11480]|uniref:DUF1574 domain-containing protein n=1 Tax=Romeriopsis navalis LEGE 11480 TaxID=2777977 RepID=A0A928VGS8_9CYAN|nr:hypothetical protein [Romeriopsis navalis]MBE9028318.1 DUF1574 domain-containing protein [Romeriopsis navalis LEGE 11480]